MSYFMIFVFREGGLKFYSRFLWIENLTGTFFSLSFFLLSSSFFFFFSCVSMFVCVFIPE